jgi:hypothetical protein
MQAAVSQDRRKNHNMPFYESRTRTNLLPLTRLIGMGGPAGYLLLGFEVMRVTSIRGRDLSNYAAVDSSAILQIAYLGVCLLYVIYHWARSPQRGAFYLLKATPVLPLAVYAVLCTLSSLWSLNHAVTFYRSVECMTYLVLIAIVCDNLNLRCSRQEFIEWLVLWSVWFLAWDFLRVIRVMGAAAFVPGNAFRAGNFALSAVFFLALFLSKRRLFILVNVIFMVLSQANTAYFGAFFGLIPGLCVGDRRSRIALFFLSGLVILAFLWAGTDVVQYTLFHGKPGIGLSQTSGRDQVWQYTLAYGMNRPLCGYGFAAGETEALSAGGAGALTAHNVFLSAFLSVGVSGPLLFLAFFGWLMCASLRSDLPANWRSAFLGTTIMIVITSVASPGLGARVYGAWVPSVLVCMAISALTASDTLRELNAATMGWSRGMLADSAL